MQAVQMRVVIIGCGDPLHGDEAIAWEAARELCSLWAITSVLVRFCDKITSELAQAVSKADLVIFIGTDPKELPGRISSEHVGMMKAPGLNTPLEPAGLLGYVHDRFGTSPEAWRFTVGADRFGLGTGISDPVRSAMPGLLGQVSDLVSKRVADHAAATV